MKTLRSALFLSLCLVVLSYAASYRAAGPEKRAIGLDDIMAWKATSVPTLSEDGTWFAYRLTPNEGNGDAVIRQTKGDKQYTFPIGEEPEAPAAAAGAGQRGQNGGAGGPALAFSSDAKYAALLAYPTH